jgi:hypothetical protein
MDGVKVFTAEQKRAAALREVALRKNVFRRKVQAGTMTAEKAEHEIAVMQAIADDYTVGSV